MDTQWFRRCAPGGLMGVKSPRMAVVRSGRGADRGENKDAGVAQTPSIPARSPARCVWRCQMSRYPTERVDQRVDSAPAFLLDADVSRDRKSVVWERV